MYLKDKVHRITVRVNDKQYEFLKESSASLDVDPSEFLRMVVASTMTTVKAMSSKLIKAKLIKRRN
jgi:hypothetical protein